MTMAERIAEHNQISTDTIYGPLTYDMYTICGHSCCLFLPEFGHLNDEYICGSCGSKWTVVDKSDPVWSEISRGI